MLHRIVACWTFHVRACSVVSDSANPCTVACQAILSMGFPRQEYWSGCHFLLQRIFLIQWSNPGLLCLLYWQADSLPLSHLGSPNLPHLPVKVFLMTYYPAVASRYETEFFVLICWQIVIHEIEKKKKKKNNHEIQNRIVNIKHI